MTPSPASSRPHRRVRYSTNADIARGGKPAGIASQLSKLAASNNAQGNDKSKVDF